MVSGLVPVWSVPIEFPRRFISVNPRNCTTEFPRKCISVVLVLNSLTAIRVLTDSGGIKKLPPRRIST